LFQQQDGVSVGRDSCRQQLRQHGLSTSGGGESGRIVVERFGVGLRFGQRFELRLVESAEGERTCGDGARVSAAARRDEMESRTIRRSDGGKDGSRSLTESTKIAAHLQHAPVERGQQEESYRRVRRQRLDEGPGHRRGRGVGVEADTVVVEFLRFGREREGEAHQEAQTYHSTSYQKFGK
jgi:hypothetical protein